MTQNNKNVLQFWLHYTRKMLQFHVLDLIHYMNGHYASLKENRKELSLNQKHKGAAIEKPLFVVQGCLKMQTNYMKLQHCSYITKWKLQHILMYLLLFHG